MMEFDFAGVEDVLAMTGATRKVVDPGLLNYYEQLDNRVLWLDVGVDSAVTEMSRKILLWNKQDENIPVEVRIPIRLMIFSDGGCQASMMHLGDIIMLSKTPVYTYNLGIAASAAFYLLVCGHKRFATEHAVGMWHAGSLGLQGTQQQVMQTTKMYQAQDAQIKDVILKRTTIDEKLYKKQKDADWWMFADDMLKYGVVDAIVGDINEIL